jgi:hypothetical protein
MQQIEIAATPACCNETEDSYKKEKEDKNCNSI